MEAGCPRTFGDRASEAGVAVAVMEDAGGHEDLPGETSGGDDVVVPGDLVEGHQHRQGLAYMDVEGVVVVLKRVGSLDLHELHLVALYPEVDGGHQAYIGNPEEVRLP